MKFTSVAMRFTDIDSENARLDIILDPPLPEGTNIMPSDVEEQPCMDLVNQLIAYLNWLKSRNGVALETKPVQVGEQPEDGGSGIKPETIH